MGLIATFNLNRDLINSLKNSAPYGDLLLNGADTDTLADMIDKSGGQGDRIEAIVLGSEYPEPVQMAQRVRAADRDISIVAVAQQADLSRLQKAFQFAVFVGDQVECVAEADNADVVRSVERAVQRTRRRRQHSQILSLANISVLGRAHGISERGAIHLDKLLDYAPVGIAITARDGTILAWNRKAQEVSGKQERDVISRPLSSLFSLLDHASWPQVLASTEEQNAPVTIEVCHEVNERTLFDEMTIGRLNSDGQPKLMAVFHDVSEQKRALSDLKAAKEHAEAANIAKSTFLANISHEIRTPIGAILGFLELMKQPENSVSDQANFMATIERNGQQLLRLIDDILDFSRIEAGKTLFIRSRLCLMEMLADIKALMEFRAGEKGLAFNLKVTNHIPIFIESDPVRIRQILANVIGNAIKFTETGAVELSVEFQQDHLRFSVADTGIGITPDHAARLFRPFTQVDSSFTRKVGGTGLGLALSKKLAEGLGGSLRLVTSEPGKGSVFEFDLPVTLTDDTRLGGLSSLTMKMNHETTGHEASPRKLAGMRILLVEDSKDNQILISHYLRPEGASVDCADNGFTGVTMAMERPYDVVLMDMQMPVCSGIEATSQLRARGYRGPIVALTALAMEHERQRALASGCNEYLTKPINKQSLLLELEKHR